MSVEPLPQDLLNSISSLHQRQAPVCLQSLKIQSRKSGQALIEYALLISIAASLALAFTGFFTRSIGQGIQRFNAVLESELRSSGYRGAGVEIWEN